MDARYEARRKALLDECTMAPEVFEQVLPRLQSFLEPFGEHWDRSEPRQHLTSYMRGLLSDLQDKNVESLAYRFGHGRMALQRFVGHVAWDEKPLPRELVRQVAHHLGEPDGVIVFDPSAFPKSGTESVGVARQWCGRLGKVENCQVGLLMGYVSRIEQTLVDMRLYLPKVWTDDKERLHKAQVPKDQQRHRTRHQLCLEMLAETGSVLPHGWVAGDEEMGKVYSFRRNLNTLEEQYLLAIPSNLLIRDRDRELPPYSGRGRRPQRPWPRVDAWTQSVAEEAWTRIDVRDGSKGPLVVEIVTCPVVARQPNRQQGHDDVLVVIRSRDRDQDEVVPVDYYLSNASAETAPAEFARVAKAAHRIEECIQRGKSEVGLADYEVRTWPGWHHHLTLSMLATWFFVLETRRGKKMDPGDHAPANPRGHRSAAPPRQRLRPPEPHPARTRTTIAPQRTCPLLPLETT